MKYIIRKIISVTLIILITYTLSYSQTPDQNIRVIQFNRIGQQETVKKGEDYRIIYGVANPENTRIRYIQSTNSDEYILELVHFQDLVKASEEPMPDISNEELNRIKAIDSLKNIIKTLSEKEQKAFDEKETQITEKSDQDNFDQEIINDAKPEDPVANNEENENIKIADLDAKLFTNKVKYEENIKNIESLQQQIKNSKNNDEPPAKILKLQEELNELMKRNNILLDENNGLSNAKNILQKDIEVKRIALEKSNQLTWLLIIIIVLILILAVAFYFNYRSKKKANIELKRLNEELADKNYKISEAHKQITDSIDYALKIQQAVLPNKDKLAALLPDFFILFKPKSTVSGDFYWIEEIDGFTFVAVVDCTGHGVPGAFMSIIGNDLLNQIVKERKIYEPSRILHELHVGVRTALQQKDVIGEQQDGMETCFIRIEDDSITFAGAKRPLWYVKDKEFHEIKGNRKPIGGRQKEEAREFDDHRIDIDSSITIYLTSDGFQDQNNPKNKSYSSKQLKNFLYSISDKNISLQCKLLSDELSKHADGEPNRDDITILSFKLNPRGRK
jgi:serine phosphatase RsbU (regulator of sigma subunit)/HAMP domain-containing protein